MARLRHILALIRGSLWLVPALMSAAAIGLAVWLLASGAGLSALAGSDLWWLYSGDADTARDLLSTLLSGMITMTSLVVSMTFVTLTLAASQLGPRLIRNFIADRQIQTVLGLFVATILYLLIILRSLDQTLGAQGVPHLAVTVGSILSVLCLFALLFYVHKIARSIISDTVVHQVGSELRQAVAAMLSDDPAPGEETGAADRPTLTVRIALGRAGYIETIDYEALVSLAQRHDFVARVLVRAGHFVLRHGDHVEILADEPPGKDVIAAVRGAFSLGSERSPAQDLEFSIRQLVEVAVRALSPGINDPYTAIAALDRLGAALEDVLERSLQPVTLRDSEGQVRVLAARSDLDGLFDAAFHQIRQNGSQHPAVLIRIADVLAALGPSLETPEQRSLVQAHLDRLEGTAQAGLSVEGDRQAVLARIAQARAAVERSRAPAISGPEGFL